MSNAPTDFAKFDGMDDVGFLSRSKEYLGSLFEIKVPKESVSVCEECFLELGRIEKEYSRFLEGSELSRVNSELGVWHKVSPEFIFLVQKSLEFYKKTNENFDITLKSSLESLGYDKDYSFKEKKSRDNVLSRLRHKLFGSIKIDALNSTIRITKQIEFGGFGKGYCLDRLSSILDAHKIRDYYINAGGDIYAKNNSSIDGWTVLLEHPDDPERAIGQIKLNNKAIAGSAPNRRRWGKYHHLLNAKTKMPQDKVKCIFVIADTGIDADAYATALFTAGFEEGIKLSKKLPVEILIVSSKDKMYVSDGFNAEIFK